MVNCIFLGLSPEKEREAQEREGQSQDIVCNYEGVEIQVQLSCSSPVP